MFSYIKPQQSFIPSNDYEGCISLFSYIKPQPLAPAVGGAVVVYLCFPTSNRNPRIILVISAEVVYLCFPTSNRNKITVIFYCKLLYIFVFLHQTATLCGHSIQRARCISLFSYIKPQHILAKVETSKGCISLFSYIKPQHLHECENKSGSCISLFSYIKPQQLLLTVDVLLVVYLCFPTSNRNSGCVQHNTLQVVYLCFPTSNRNAVVATPSHRKLYIFVFLHQTATLP